VLQALTASQQRRVASCNSAVTTTLRAATAPRYELQQRHSSNATLRAVAALRCEVQPCCVARRNSVATLLRCEAQQRRNVAALRIAEASWRAAPKMTSTSVRASSTIAAKHYNAIATFE